MLVKPAKWLGRPGSRPTDEGSQSTLGGPLWPLHTESENFATAVNQTQERRGNDSFDR